MNKICLFTLSLMLMCQTSFLSSSEQERSEGMNNESGNSLENYYFKRFGAVQMPAEMNIAAANVFLNASDDTEDSSMKVLDVIKVFDDSEKGMIFTLSDGSLWYRPVAEEPILHLEFGQKIGVIPMSEEEASYFTPPFENAKPYWISLSPSGEVTTAIVYVAFQLEGLE